MQGDLEGVLYAEGGGWCNSREPGRPQEQALLQQGEPYPEADVLLPILPAVPPHQQEETEEMFQGHQFFFRKLLTKFSCNSKMVPETKIIFG